MLSNDRFKFRSFYIRLRYIPNSSTLLLNLQRGVGILHFVLYLSKFHVNIISVCEKYKLKC